MNSRLPTNPFARSCRRASQGLIIGALLLTTAALPCFSQKGSPDKTKIDAALLQAMADDPEGRFEAIVYLEEQADWTGLDPYLDWEVRGRRVYQTLTELASRSQGELLAEIEHQISAGQVGDYLSYWVVNAVYLSGASTDALLSLADRPDVGLVGENLKLEIPEPETPESAPQATVGWNVQQVGADQVWADFGITGAGVVVANIDTGVAFNHPALINQYRGTVTGTHDYNWYDPTGTFPTAPGDNNNHGTHTMGTMVGDDGAGNQIGVAPGAHWVAAKGCASSSCSTNHLLSAGQWILAPTDLAGNNADPSRRPHIVNNSWGSCASANTWYQATVNAWVAAGIFPAFSAGNWCTHVGSPASYASSFATGAVDAANNIAPFSAPGPSPLTPNVKPDLVAPGVSVRSSIASGGYADFNGTSMASPHTAGCPALVKQILPNLPPVQMADLLRNSATDLGPPGPESTFGHGLLSCLQAVTVANSPGCWDWRWGAQGQFGTWIMNTGDLHVIGDFDADSKAEILSRATNGWAHLQSFAGTSWTTDWSNLGSGNLGGWALGAGDRHVAGDFDGDGRDELLSIATNGLIFHQEYQSGSWPVLWATATSNIGGWYVNPPDTYIAGDFNNDGRDELLAINPNNGFAKLLRYSSGTWASIWGNGGSGQIPPYWYLNPGDQFIGGDWNGDNRDSLLTAALNGWSQDMTFSGGTFQFNGGNGGSGQIAFWFLNPGDIFVPGDYDGNGADELFSVALNGWSHLSERPATAWSWICGNGGLGKIAYWYMHSGDRYLSGDLDGDGTEELVAISTTHWIHVMNRVP